jgi:hypothetical protein
MSDTSRRGFLTIAGVGAAGVAAASVAGLVPSAASGAVAAPATKLPDDASGSLVAYVSDVRAGQVSVLVGESEVLVTDHELVARLAQAASTAKSTGV